MVAALGLHNTYYGKRVAIPGFVLGFAVQVTRI